MENKSSLISRSTKTEVARNLPQMLQAQTVLFLKDVKEKVQVAVREEEEDEGVEEAAMAVSPEVVVRMIALVAEEVETITRLVAYYAE
jgi:hypothetical protein